MAGALMGALLATTAIAGAAYVSPALAQASVQRTFSVPAGPLEAVLADFGEQSGLQVTYLSETATGLSSPGFAGTSTAAAALDALLGGTGLSYVFINNTTVSISGAAPTSSMILPEQATMLERLVIYGARNAATLGETSASLGVVTSTDIENGQMSHLDDTFRRLGNVMDSATLNAGFVIRGMSSEGFVPAGAPVGSLYVDGVLQTRYNARFGARNLWDVEQVEVYRGPQSTLSGRAALSGAIYIKSKDPTFDPEILVSTTIGNNARAGGAFVVNAPIVDDQLAMRVSGSFERADASVNYPSFVNFAGYDDLTTELSGTIKTKILLTPTDLPDTRALLSYSYTNERPNERLIGVGPGFDLDDDRGDFYDPVTYAEFRAIKVHSLGLEVTHDLNENLRLTSQTGFQYGETTRRSVDAGTPGLVDGIWGTVGDTLLTQEVRLNYDDGDRLKWVAGAFGSLQNFDSSFDAVAYAAYQWDQFQNRKTRNLAAFGEVTYEVLPSWYATLGGRIDYLREITVEDNAEGAYGTVLPVVTNQADFDEWNFVPKISIAKEFDDAHTLALTYSEGFRTGGFYVNYDTLTAEYYDPERTRNIELSYKGMFLDDRLTLNANLFYTRYEDQQVEVRPDPARPSYRETTNAASSQAWGFEIEPNFQVNESFSAFASIGYLQTEFLEFNHAQYGDMAGQAFPEAPEWTIGLGGQYAFDNGLYVGADAKYTAGYTARFGVPPADKIDDRILVNAQLGYKQENWEVNAFAENLFDTRYLTVVDNEATPIYAQRGEGRSVGLNLKARF